jgi:hypothetical protein
MRLFPFKLLASQRKMEVLQIAFVPLHLNYNFYLCD